MQPTKEQRVPYGEHALQGTRRILPDWDAVRIFLDVVRKGSLRGAAEHLNISVNAVRRRVEELEHALGAPLVTRHVDGVRVTPEGERVLNAASQMERASFSLLQASEQDESDLNGEVRLAVTEGLGTFWIAPRLVEFQRANPNLLIDVNCAMKSADVLRLEADVSIQLTRPTAPDLRILKLGRLHVVPFASESYLATYGTPKTSMDLVHHRILIQSDDSQKWQELYNRLFPGVDPSKLVAMRTNVSSAHYWSIAKGGGIGVLPTYGLAIGAPLVPLDLGIHESVDIWLTFHPDAKRIRRVARLIEWVVQSFSQKKFPWFRDEFIHPLQLEKAYKGEPLVNMFSGFIGRKTAA